MSSITVYILPSMEGRGPMGFSTHQRHDAAYIIGCLREKYGSGRLQDPKGYVVIFDPGDKLGAGNYLYILYGPGTTCSTRLQNPQFAYQRQLQGGRPPSPIVAACLSLQQEAMHEA